MFCNYRSCGKLECFAIIGAVGKMECGKMECFAIIGAVGKWNVLQL